jgi:hypothetical protein
MSLCLDPTMNSLGYGSDDESSVCFCHSNLPVVEWSYSRLLEAMVERPPLVRWTSWRSGFCQSTTRIRHLPRHKASFKTICASFTVVDVTASDAAKTYIIVVGRRTSGRSCPEFRFVICLAHRWGAIYRLKQFCLTVSRASSWNRSLTSASLPLTSTHSHPTIPYLLCAVTVAFT